MTVRTNLRDHKADARQVRFYQTSAVPRKTVQDAIEYLSSTGFNIFGLTAVTPAMGDSIPLSDASDSNTNKRSTLTQIQQLLDDQVWSWTGAHTFAANIAAASTGVLIGGSAGGRFGGVWADYFTTNDGANNWTIQGASTLLFQQNGAGGFRMTPSAYSPNTSDGGALGTTALMWSDLFLASGGVLNFNNGDVTVTHGADTLAFAGAASGYFFDSSVNIDVGDLNLTRTSNPYSFITRPNSVGSKKLGFAVNGGTALDEFYVNSLATLIAGGPLSPFTSDGAALGTTALMWSDLFLASGAVINFNNGDVLITHAANALQFSGASTEYSFLNGPVRFGATTASAPTNVGIVRMTDGGEFAANTGLEWQSTTTGSGYGWKVVAPDRGGGNAPLAFGYRSSATTWTELFRFRMADAPGMELLSGTLRPGTNDAAALGTTALMWSDLFLASGAVINFNNGDVTITHALNTLTVAGGILAMDANSTIGGSVIARQSQVFDWNVFIETPANQDYDVVINCSFAGTINEITTDCLSGTATVTTKINTTAVTGTANSASTTEQTQTPSGGNTFVAGDNIRLTISANASCADLSVKLKYTRTLA